MITRSELTQYLDEFLNCRRYQDYAPNGLQVEGKEQIQRLCTAVTASDEVISQAVAWQADALLVHHGYFWRGEDPTIVGIKRQRISKLLNHNLNLFAYHLPLDCHIELGNNACLAKLFAVNNVQMHKVDKVENILWSGELNKEQSIAEFGQFIEKQLGRTPQIISAQEKPIRRIAWCSGAAQDYLEQASRLGVDAYLSGEISERTYYQAKELGINYFCCGHHATERYGIQALGKQLTSQFALEHCYIESDNPI
ncbi:MAG: Nif3-like dinuclear metal center hexameric protein [Legionella sp.]|nr:MAG: Nif3-like dinuclear metal center hexameric protein [Legionella sp.]